jgi:beta-glucosidase/6-phospho-beta-glucosidase/beta-galactosidase
VRVRPCPESSAPPFDFIGINNYTRYLITTAQPSTPGGLPGQLTGGEDGPKTANGWEVWPKGFRRFGIVHVDFATQKRTIKDSGHWLSRVAAANAVLDTSS